MTDTILTEAKEALAQGKLMTKPQVLALIQAEKDLAVQEALAHQDGELEDMTQLKDKFKTQYVQEAQTRSNVEAQLKTSQAVTTSFRLKVEQLKAELEDTRGRLAQEMKARTDLVLKVERMKALKDELAQAIQADQLVPQKDLEDSQYLVASLRTSKAQLKAELEARTKTRDTLVLKVDQLEAELEARNREKAWLAAKVKAQATRLEAQVLGIQEDSPQDPHRSPVLAAIDRLAQETQGQDWDQADPPAGATWAKSPEDGKPTVQDLAQLFTWLALFCPDSKVQPRIWDHFKSYGLGAGFHWDFTGGIWMGIRQMGSSFTLDVHLKPEQDPGGPDRFPLVSFRG